jgi:hypothetical protein
LIVAWAIAASPALLDGEPTRASEAVRGPAAITELRAVRGARDVAITWSTSGRVEEVDIEVSTDGERFEPIAVASPNMGRFDWAAPSSFSGVVRVRATDGDAAAAVHCGDDPALERREPINRAVMARLIGLLRLLRT